MGKLQMHVTTKTISFQTYKRQTKQWLRLQFRQASHIYNSLYFSLIGEETEKQCFLCLQEAEKCKHSSDIPISMGLTKTSNIRGEGKGIA